MNRYIEMVNVITHMLVGIQMKMVESEMGLVKYYEFKQQGDK